MIEVLWIDDECKDANGQLTPMGQEFIELAYDKGIKITPMLTYKEGLNAIKGNRLKWCAVILDIRNQRATENVADDYNDARYEIEGIQKRFDQKEPYIFVLSGEKQYHNDNLTIRKERHCTKRVYDKNNGEYELLFDDILKIKEISTLYNCQFQYSDVLTNALQFCGESTYVALLKLFVKISVDNVKDESSLLNDMRKILEDIMTGLKTLGYDYFSNINEEKTLNNLSVYIGKDETIPEYIKRSFHTLTRIVQSASHRSEVDYDILNSKAPYLLRSSLYELCNILIWMRSLT